jgi:LuxR family maltose regulon positive regulatory protein
MSIPLLKSKLSIPSINNGQVSRPRLIERLNYGLESKLTLISAPAGYGKTTLLSSWAASCGLPVAWFTLDSGDNDPVRFVTYLVAALQLASPNHAQEMKEVIDSLTSFQPFNAVYGMTAILEQLEVSSEKFILILEDYHFITNSEIRQAISFLLDHQPPQLHLFLSTRVDPPLSLAKIRARGQLNELRQADLRFNQQEMQAFVTHWTGNKLLSSEITTLANRTEGWIAGLQMACLSLQNSASQSREEISRLVASFGGSHEYIVDFFATEILAQQTELVRSFLLQTSILDPLCSELCNTVTGRTDSQSMLEYLQKANLFVIPLDQERHWYHYHPLFSDLLRKQLHQESSAMVSELHSRASVWYESNKLLDLAFQHACSAGDQARIGWMADEYAESFWKMGEYGTILRWFNNLSNDQLILHPELMIAKAILLSDQGVYHQAEALLEEITRKIMDKMELLSSNQGNSDIDNSLHPERILGLVYVATAHIAFLKSDYETTIMKACQALDLLAAFHLQWDVPWQCEALISLGHALWLTGDRVTAIQHLGEAISLSRSYKHHHLFLIAAADQAFFYRLQNRFDQAEQVCRDGLSYIHENNLERYSITAGLLIIWGAVLCEQGNFEMADEFLQRGLKLSQNGRDDTVHWVGILSLGGYWALKGDMDKAGACLQEAQSLASKKKITPWLSTIMSEEFPELMQLPNTKGITTQRSTVKTHTKSTLNLPIEKLSERECEVLHLLAEGLSNNQIAERLYLTVRTVKFHTGNIYRKLGVTRRTEAIAQARTLGLLS